MAVMPRESGASSIHRNEGISEVCASIAHRGYWVPAFAGTTTKNHELPINIPEMNTNTPPTTIWNAAFRNGVSMYL